MVEAEMTRNISGKTRKEWLDVAEEASLLCFWVSLLTTVAIHAHFVDLDMHMGKKYNFVGNGLCLTII